VLPIYLEQREEIKIACPAYTTGSEGIVAGSE